MSRSHAVARGALLAGAVGAFVVACNTDTSLSGPTPLNTIFSSYVALGNSITAGYQSGGINDSTQRQSYALILATAMGTRFAFPSLVKPGCPPPISNLLTGARVGGSTSTGTTCLLRDPASVTTTLNNVAVPGITTFDPTAIGNPTNANLQNNNPLVQLILGGESMVQKALDNHPTFASVWVGNNDILAPALNGLPNGATGVVGPFTPVATFTANYKKMIDQLTAGAPGLKGVLIGVVQVAGAPLMFQAGALANPTVAAAAAQVAGRPVTLDPVTCAGTNAGALVNFQYLVAIRSRPAAQPGTVFCQPVSGGGATDPGDNGILDLNEQALVGGTVAAYNAYIKAKADTIGFAYFDPSPVLDSLHKAGAIPAFPNLASTTAPFGQFISLDGVHPAAAAHKLIANHLMDVINAKYGTNLVHVTVP
jgi:lysophospholipase L1-like esterase